MNTLSNLEQSEIPSLSNPFTQMHFRFGVQASGGQPAQDFPAGQAAYNPTARNALTAKVVRLTPAEVCKTGNTGGEHASGCICFLS